MVYCFFYHTLSCTSTKSAVCIVLMYSDVVVAIVICTVLIVQLHYDPYFGLHVLCVLLVHWWGG